MGLRDEWIAMRETVERVAVDLVELTTDTHREHEGAVAGRIVSVVQLDGDTHVRVHGAALDLRACHAAAVTFTAALASARLRMVARVGRALIG